MHTRLRDQSYKQDQREKIENIRVSYMVKVLFCETFDSFSFVCVYILGHEVKCISYVGCSKNKLAKHCTIVSCSQRM